MKVHLEQLQPVHETLEDFYEQRYEGLFLHVARYISKRGGTLEDARDVYHDALVLYYERIDKSDFQLQTTEEAYITGIVKHLWAQKMKYALRSTSLSPEFDDMETETEAVDQKRLYTVIVSSGKKCLDLLSAFYDNHTTLKNIAASFGFGSEHSAAVQKYKCLEKIRETVKQNSLCHEDFFE